MHLIKILCYSLQLDTNCLYFASTADINSKFGEIDTQNILVFGITNKLGLKEMNIGMRLAVPGNKFQDTYKCQKSMNFCWLIHLATPIK
jgi:hypothetical protein